MPGVVPQNLHSGFLNEEYGILLLRQLAAVAAIGRAEDHGIDAVATLLPSANGYLHAADTFLIQFKSALEDTVPFGGKADEVKGEADWLRSLQIPLFFGSVSRLENGDPGKLRIYSSQYLSGPLNLYPDLRCISVCFSPEHQVPSDQDKQNILEQFRADANQGEWTSSAEADTWVNLQWANYISKLERTVWWLGEPIVEFDLPDASDPDFREHIISVLQTWIRVGYENVATSSLGMFRYMRWRTNQLPIVNIIIKSPWKLPPHQSNQVTKAAATHLVNLLADQIFHGTSQTKNLILDLIESLRADGHPVSVQREFVETNWKSLHDFRVTYRATHCLPKDS